MPSVAQPARTPDLVLEIPSEFLDYLPNAVGILALDGSVRAVNRAALQLLNFHTSEVIGRHFTYFLRPLQPPLLSGGFAALLELGGAIFDIALRCGEDRFVQIAISLAVVHDDQAQPSGVLVTSSEGDPEHYLLRRATAQVADRVSRMIAFEAPGERFWHNTFAYCQELFETPGGWLSLHGQENARRSPLAFGSAQRAIQHAFPGVLTGPCPCSDLPIAGRNICATNALDCPWLKPQFDTIDSGPILHHHAVAPILNSTGEKIGDICLLAPEDRIFHRHELALMDAITDQIGQALERGELQLPGDLEQLSGRTALAAEERRMELAAVLEQILKNLAAVVPFVSAGVFLQEKDGLRLMAALNRPDAPDLRGEYFPHPDNLLNQEILRTRTRIILDDVRADPRFHAWGGLEYIRGWMGLPLVVNGAVIGIITLDRETVGAFTQADGLLAQAFADQAAIAVEKVQLASELGRDKQNLELLYQLSQTLVAVLEPEAVAVKALELLSPVFGDCFGEIYLIESGNNYLQLLATVGYQPDVVEKLPDQPYLRSGTGIIGASVEMRRPLFVPNVLEDPRWIHVPELKLFVRSVVSIPLISRNEVVGALVLGSPEINAFTHKYLLLFQAIAGSVALALQNARLFVAERRRRQEAEMLRNATSALTLDLRLEQILRILLERLRQVVHFDSACVMLLEGRELYALAEIGLSRPEEVLGRRFPVADSFFAQIQREGKALYYDDVQALVRFSGWGGTTTTRGWMGVPLIHRGDVLGYITLDSLEVGSFGAREAAAAQAFANQVAITLVNAQLLLDSQRAAFEQQEVSHILRGLNGSATLADIQTAATIGLHRLIGPGAVEIALYPADGQLIVSERSFWTEAAGEYRRDARAYAVEDSAAVAALRAGKSHFSRDLEEDQNWLIEKEWFLQGYSSAMALPLQGNDRVLGHIRLFWREGLGPNQAIHFSLPQITEGVALAIQKLALLEQTTRRANELQSLTELSSKLRRVHSREQVTQVVLNHSLALFQADRVYVLTPIPEEGMLQVFAHVGKGPVAPHTQYGFIDSIAGSVFLSGTPYCSANLFSDPAGHRPTLQIWAESGLDFVSALYAPLRAGDTIVGVISMTNSETRRSFSPADLRLFNALAEIAGGALHRSAILERLEQRVEERTADLAAANLRLRELDQMKSDFVANVSHELRTPLTNITLYLDLINRGKPERREHYMRVLQRETGQLRHLVESILDLSALDRKGDIRAETFSIVDLSDVLETLLPHFQAKALESGILLSLNSLEKRTVVLGYQEGLNQLLAHLMNNAIHYTPAGGRVEVGLLHRGKEVALYVQDTGIGMDEDEIEQIFERFYRGKEVRQSDILGAGLGLSIVSGIAQAHGGRIVVESVRGQGSTFTVWFPTAYSSTTASAVSSPGENG